VRQQVRVRAEDDLRIVAEPTSDNVKPEFRST
jgi:hypothetical protein